MIIMPYTYIHIYIHITSRWLSSQNQCNQNGDVNRFAAADFGLSVCLRNCLSSELSVCLSDGLVSCGSLVGLLWVLVLVGLGLAPALGLGLALLLS